MVRDALQQISGSKNAYETAIVIQDRNSMNPFIQDFVVQQYRYCNLGVPNRLLPF